MKLLKITKNGSLHFQLSDGRIGVTYDTGYVRVSVKGIKNRLYQINQQTFTDPKDNSRGYTFVKRELLPNQIDRINMLIAFNLKNCKN
jgi:hypothetical protein|tara:strand:+ start:153 stop:416 length:264 start_codon:yes stop_codon:yes gene_type:complete